MFFFFWATKGVDGMIITRDCQEQNAGVRFAAFCLCEDFRCGAGSEPKCIWVEFQSDFCEHFLKFFIVISGFGTHKNFGWEQRFEKKRSHLLSHGGIRLSSVIINFVDRINLKSRFLSIKSYFNWSKVSGVQLYFAEMGLPIIDLPEKDLVGRIVVKFILSSSKKKIRTAYTHSSSFIYWKHSQC